MAFASLQELFERLATILLLRQLTIKPILKWHN